MEDLPHLVLADLEEDLILELVDAIVHGAHDREEAVDEAVDHQVEHPRGLLGQLVAPIALAKAFKGWTVVMVDRD